MISLLLDLGASPNMVDLKGRSPAMRAAEFGHVQALILLTEAGTDMTSNALLCFDIKLYHKINVCFFIIFIYLFTIL